MYVCVFEVLMVRFTYVQQALPLHGDFMGFAWWACRRLSRAFMRLFPGLVLLYCVASRGALVAYLCFSSRACTTPPWCCHERWWRCNGFHDDFLEWFHVFFCTVVVRSVLITGFFHEIVGLPVDVCLFFCYDAFAHGQDPKNVSWDLMKVPWQSL